MKRTVKFMVALLAVAAITGLMACGGDKAANTGGGSEYSTTKKDYGIHNTEDWIDFVSAASNIEEIDNGYSSMSANQIINTTEELVKMVRNLHKDDSRGKAKCRALYYSIILPMLHIEGKTNSDFALNASEQERLEKIFHSSTCELAAYVVNGTLGSEVKSIDESFKALLSKRVKM